MADVGSVDILALIRQDARLEQVAAGKASRRTVGSGLVPVRCLAAVVGMTASVFGRTIPVGVGGGGAGSASAAEMP